MIASGQARRQVALRRSHFALRVLFIVARKQKGRECAALQKDARRLRLDRFKAACNGRNASARQLNKAQRAHQLNKVVDLRGRAGQLENKTF